MTAIQVIRPIPVTDTRLVYSSLVEGSTSYDGTLWNPTGNYVVGNRVYTTTHEVYQCVEAVSNHTVPPSEDTTHWVYVSKTNRWKMFDTANSSESTSVFVVGTPTTVTVRLRPQRVFNTVTCLNLTYVKTVRVVVYSSTDSGVTKGVIYHDETISLLSEITKSSWYEHFFGFRRAQGEFSIVELSSVVPTTAYIELVFTSVSSVNDDEDPSPTMRIGNIIVGKKEVFGVGAQYGAKLGMLDYSIKEKDEWGNTILTERVFAKTLEFVTKVEKEFVDSTNYFLLDYRARNLVWVITQEYRSVLLFGFIKTFDTTINYATYAEINIQLEGLT